MKWNIRVDESSASTSQEPCIHVVSGTSTSDFILEKRIVELPWWVEPIKEKKESKWLAKQIKRRGWKDERVRSVLRRW